MDAVLIAAGLVLIIPTALALGAREQGQEVLERMIGVAHQIPALIQEGAAEACRRAWNRYREALRWGGIRESWVQQTVGALVIAPVAVLSILALFFNLIYPLLGSFELSLTTFNQLVAAVLGLDEREAKLVPVVLTCLEVLLPCILYPALVLDLLGVTNISYYFSSENIESKWLRWAFMGAFGIGAIASGYLLWESAIVRKFVVGGAGNDTSLVQDTGLVRQGSLDSGAPVSPDAKASSEAEKAPTEAIGALMTWPALLGFIAGAVALVFIIPAATLLVATPLFLAVRIPAGIIWVIARLVTGFMNGIYSFLLSLFNFALRLRGEEPVGGPDNRTLPGDTGGQEGSADGTQRDDRAFSGRGPSDRSPTPRGETPARGSRDGQDGSAENGRSDDPAEDAAQTGPLYDEDDENWNPIA